MTIALQKIQPLQFETGNQEADKRILGFLQRVHTSFPNRISAAYLAGSWSDGSAVSRSDLDIVLTFRGGISSEEKKLLGSLVREINSEDGIEIGPLALNAGDLENPIPAYLKSAAHLLGEDVFAELDIIPVEVVSSRWSFGALRLMQLLRGSEDALQFPIHAPDPHSATRGFHLETSSMKSSTKLVVNTAARIAGARLAEEANAQAFSKRHCLMEFNRLIGGEFSDYISDCTRILKVKWEYGVPKGGEELAKLGRILDEHVKFENDFLERLRVRIEVAEQSGVEIEWTTACRKRVLFT